MYHNESLSRNQNPSLYVVDFEEGGYVVVNAYRNAETEVFAVVNDGQFDDSDNSGLRYYMNFASERAAASVPASRANGPIGIGGGNGSEIIKGDKVIEDKEWLMSMYTSWSRYEPYNKLCNLMPNSTERYPLGTFATVLGSMVSYHKYINDYMDDETFKDGKRYTLHWFDMLSGRKYESVNEVGKNDICILLNYLNNLDDEYLSEGKFTSHTNAESQLRALVGESQWFTSPKLYLNYVSPSDIYINLLTNGPQMMYGETENETIGDVWMIQGAKYITYEKENPNLQDPITGEQDPTGSRERYTVSYLYLNWCLGGRGNGWFFYNGVWYDYYNNQYDSPDYDPNYPTDNYMYNVIPVMDIKYKKTA